MNARNRFRLVFASALSVAMLMPLATTAYASGSLSVKKIGTKTAPYKKSVTVSPSYKRTGNVQVSSALLTVKKGKKTVKKNAKKVKLKAGTYKVTQKVKYRTWSNTKARKVVVTPGQKLFSEYLTADGDPFIDQCTYTAVSRPNLTMQCNVMKWVSDSDVSLGNFKVTGSFTEDVSGYVTYKIDGASHSGYTSVPVVGGFFDLDALGVVGISATKNLHETITKRKYSKYKTKTKTHKLKVKQGKKPGRTDPISAWKCPSWAPIKGNANSGIYHMKHQRFYHKTKPEDCFSSEKAARKAGYRKSKV